MQVALNSHDGPLFLEQANHIPEEYHKYFGIQPIISSPRSESNTLVTNPDDENSNSMMSANSEKEGLITMTPRSNKIHHYDMLSTNKCYKMRFMTFNY